MKRRPWSLIAAGAVFLWMVLFATRGWWPEILPRCRFREVTGWDCPGCGGTRASLRLLEGDVWGAMRFHLPLVVIVLMAGVWLLRAVWRESRGGESTEVPTRWFLAMAVLLVVFGMVRNVPVWPFTWLALP